MSEDISIGVERGMFHIAKSMNYFSDTVSSSVDKVLIFGTVITAGLMVFSYYLAKDLTIHAFQEKAKLDSFQDQEKAKFDTFLMQEKAKLGLIQK